MILAIDISSRLGLISLAPGDGRCLGHSSERPREHLAWLGEVLPQLRGEVGKPWRELDRIAVTLGPGSFTGLRVGLAIAKGLVFGSDVPLVPLPSLAIPACAHPESKRRPALVCRPARGDESWGALIEAGGTVPTWEKLLDPEALVAAAGELGPDAMLIGELGTQAISGLAGRLVFEAEPSAAAQLTALGDLAAKSSELLRGAELDQLLPRYLMAPATSRPKPRAGGSGA